MSYSPRNTIYPTEYRLSGISVTMDELEEKLDILEKNIEDLKKIYQKRKTCGCIPCECSACKGDKK